MSKFEVILGGVPTKLFSIPVGQHPDDEFYDMTHPNQGIALIFNNQIFDNPLLNERIGTQKDRDSMEQLMNKFGFHVQIYQDYTVREIRDALYIGKLNRIRIQYIF